MLIVNYGKLLDNDLKSVSCMFPNDTPLASLSSVVKDMALAYSKDGETFLTRGDWINALAAFYYGFGWLHFGITYGLFTSQTVTTCPFTEKIETYDQSIDIERLNEKTNRYFQLLNTACTSVIPASEPDTVSERFAKEIILIGDSYAKGGQFSLLHETPEIALARFSYGHAWLDAGVRVGILKVIRNRDIFTV